LKDDAGIRKRVKELINAGVEPEDNADAVINPCRGNTMNSKGGRTGFTLT
jgi:hypothetical protein